VNKLACFGLTSSLLLALGNANAETINLPANTAALSDNCSKAFPGGEVVNYSPNVCEMSFGLPLPVGKTIDAVVVQYQLAYRWGAWVPSINASLVSNRYSPDLGVAYVATQQATNSTAGLTPLTMAPIGVTVWDGNTYLVDVKLVDGVVSVLSVTYH